MSNSKEQKVYDTQFIALGALAAATAVIAATKIDATREQGCRIKDIFGIMTHNGKTAGQGPVYYGFADANLSVAEIAEIFEADPQSQDDVPATEQIDRRIIVVGQAPHPEAIQEIANEKWERLMWPSSWVLKEGGGLNIFAFNRGTGTLTTGMVTRFDGMFNTVLLED